MRGLAGRAPIHWSRRWHQISQHLEAWRLFREQLYCSNFSVSWLALNSVCSHNKLDPGTSLPLKKTRLFGFQIKDLWHRWPQNWAVDRAGQGARAFVRLFFGAGQARNFLCADFGLVWNYFWVLLPGLPEIQVIETWTPPVYLFSMPVEFACGCGYFIGWRAKKAAGNCDCGNANLDPSKQPFVSICYVRILPYSLYHHGKTTIAISVCLGFWGSSQECALPG